jgi:hypothetical protein
MQLPGQLASADVQRHVDRLPVLARRRREILAQIRQRPGSEGFLLPPGSQALIKAAQAGPVVVVNASRHGCDALIVTAKGVRALPLGFTAPAAKHRARDLDTAVRQKAAEDVVSCLDWVWEHITGPVLDALGPAERVWWCPTGPLALLPLHAAGPALDRVISSYTPTLRALLHARRRAGPGAGRRVLLVGVASDAGQAPLPSVGRELDAIRDQWTGVEQLTGPDATHDRVLTELRDTAWVHFACHATQELGDPSRARLILFDRPLTVRELAASRMQQAEFAFLSGCETSRGGDVLADEAISIAAAVQMAGFRHVVGTLWPASDVHAPAVAADVYAALIAGGTREREQDTAAHALHAAVRALRKRRPGFPIFWASYVHMGP